MDPQPLSNSKTPISIFPIRLVHISYLLVHLGACLIFFFEFKWFYVWLCLISYFFRHFGLVAGFHRYFSHKSFKTSRVFQFILAVYGGFCGERGALWWAQTHRMHHRHSDTPLDIHSPHHQGFWYSHSGWFLNKKFAKTDNNKISDFSKFPELVWLDEHDSVPPILYGIFIYYFFGLEGFLWGFCLSTILIWHTTHTIQSICHLWGGYRRFNTPDKSRNLWLFGIISLGDGFHNNHHFYPRSARHGFVWWEFDLVWYCLKFFAFIGLIWDLKVPPKKLIDRETIIAQ